jgi:hypothetical protein
VTIGDIVIGSNNFISPNTRYLLVANSATVEEYRSDDSGAVSRLSCGAAWGGRWSSSTVLVVVRLDTCGFRSFLAREWHALEIGDPRSRDIVALCS